MSAKPLTLDEARVQLRAKIKKGAKCPVCKQFAKVYAHPLGSTMARFLIVLVKKHEQHGEWIHARDLYAHVPGASTTGGYFSLLIHWGLIEGKPNDKDPTKRCSGFWRPTQSGIDFAYGRIRVPRYIETYNGKCIAIDKSVQISVTEALGEKFDYSELMATVATSSPPL